MSARVQQIRTMGRPARFPFDIVAAKLRPPAVRRGSIARTSLLNRLRVSRARVATVVAPAGYGKSTLLAQWSEKDGRRFAWLRVDARDAEPRVFLRHLGAALDASDPLPPPVVQALSSTTGSVWTAIVPRLAATLASSERPATVVVLDDAHLLESDESLEALAALGEHMAEGSMLVIAGRAVPGLPIAALRATGRLVELGAADLELSDREAGRLLRASGVQLDEPQIAEIVSRAEGWATGLYLAALAFRDAAGAYDEPSAFSGEDRYLADYFHSEHLARLAPAHVRFLRRTSLLRRLSGPLCDYVLERDDSSTVLSRLGRSQALALALDRRGEWHRCHGLLRDTLRADLIRREPALVPILHRRAADWFEAHDDPVAAMEHAWAAGESDRVLSLLATHGLALCEAGDAAAVGEWLDRLGRGGPAVTSPAILLLDAWIGLFRGRTPEAEQSLAAAERTLRRKRPRERSSQTAARARVVRAALCRQGAVRMRADALAALGGLEPADVWRADALFLAGVASLLVGDVGHADETLAAAAEVAERVGATTVRIAALAERALLAYSRGDNAVGEALAFEGRDLAASAGPDTDVRVVLTHAASARALLRRGAWDEAREELVAAMRHVDALGDGPPWLAGQSLLELARAHVAIRSVDEALGLLRRARHAAARDTGATVLAAHAEEIQGLADEMRGASRDTASGFTAAELRLLPLLATHLSFREIGERLFVSRNTVKTQAISVYRKLGVSCRSDALDRATRLGLLDAPPATELFTAAGPSVLQ
jgi:LuxR family maltose regulon positive regulatory protein